jgi:DNA-binding NtrC family response regulator
MNRLLVADDDPSTCDFFTEILQDLSRDIVTCLEPKKAISLATEGRFDVVISDINFEQATNGIDVLRAVKKSRPETQVILVSAFGNLDTAIDAVREGAFDYVSKPFNVDEVRATVRRALLKRKCAPALPEQTPNGSEAPTLVGSSAKMLAVYKTVAYVADSKTTVLIQGESGTGKELVARAIHFKGPRGSRPFVAVNCGALTETILGREMFGSSRTRLSVWLFSVADVSSKSRTYRRRFIKNKSLGKAVSSVRCPRCRRWREGISSMC